MRPMQTLMDPFVPCNGPFRNLIGKPTPDGANVDSTLIEANRPQRSFMGLTREPKPCHRPIHTVDGRTPA